MGRQLHHHPMWFAVVVLAVAVVCGTSLAAPNGMMYQGTLADTTGNPVPTGVYPMTFTIWDDLAAGASLWAETGHTVTVTKGSFAVELGLAVPFGTIFDGNAPRWLEIAVNLGTGFQTFTPRVPFTTVPSAQKAAIADSATNADTVDGNDASAFAEAAHSHSLQALGGAVTDTQVPNDITVDHAGTADTATNATNADTLDSLHATSFWNALGNTGTTDGTNFLGTTDNVPFEIRANNLRALRIEPNTLGPNLIGGSEGNSVTASVYAATISGGSYNGVTDNYCVIGGGMQNHAGDGAGTTTDKTFATVGGGSSNTASGAYATVDGGSWNNASKTYASVGGGYQNFASGDVSTVGGGSANVASATSATIAGGHQNEANVDFATVGGGTANRATEYAATVGGGWGNEATNSYATVGGGMDNLASGNISTLGGGWLNMASGNAATVGGGQNNDAQAAFGTIAGGGPSDLANPTTTNNKVTDDYGTIGGGGRNQAGDNAGTQQDRTYATVGGGFLNIASGGASTVGGGNNNAASATFATVGGGTDNKASNTFAAVAGGWDNYATGYIATVGGGHANHADTDLATVGGGYNNFASGQCAAVSGGSSNRALAAYSTIAGGGPSDPANPTITNNKVTDDYGTIGGGGQNQAGNNLGSPQDSTYATVGGGMSNTASSYYATVGGGQGNTASGDKATVAGGYNNSASVTGATVSGGYDNSASSTGATVGGGNGNTASGTSATVVGGDSSIANADWATVGGGYGNTAGGRYSFAAGNGAKALHNGSFVWVDSSGRATDSTAANQFRVRASGGVFFYSSAANDTSGIQLAAGNSAWSALSDRNQKDNFVDVDPFDVLERVAAMPISTWNYKAQDPKFRHMGPMAQDMYAAFGLGEGETAIDTIDADGVALAAIQGLDLRLKQKDEQIAELRAEVNRLKGKEGEIAELRAELKNLTAVVAAMAAK